jgi:hypothetical protein
MSETITIESQLRPLVCEWLKANGYDVAHECWHFNFCDVVGYRFAERTSRRIPALEAVVCVELKIRDFAGVLSQCRCHRSRACEVYAAMPRHILDKTRPETRFRFADQGIGLLSVDDKVTVKIQSLKYVGEFEFARTALWAWKRGKRGRKDCK